MAVHGEPAWLDEHRTELLTFHSEHIVDPDGGYWWLDDSGRPMAEKGHPLWIGARMVHCFCLAHLLDAELPVDPKQAAQHGIDWLSSGLARDVEYDGWYVCHDGDDADHGKELYGFAFVILAGASAVHAGLDGGRDLLDRALQLVDQHFWDDEVGAGVERWNREFTTTSDYRGMNANMHLTEAYMAASEARGEKRWLERALRLARRFAGEGTHRLPEHFDVAWQPMPEHHRDQPDHPFQPYGSTPGHWLEWAKLCMQLSPHFPEERWLVPRAVELFEGAVSDAWADNGGFHYTVDWEGAPVVSMRFHWPVTEAIGAAHYLHLATGERRYQEWYERFWEFAKQYLIEGPTWHPELDDELRPISKTWVGKPDLYHALQATLYEATPLEQGMASYLASKVGRQPAAC